MFHYPLKILHPSHTPTSSPTPIEHCSSIQTAKNYAATSFFLVPQFSRTKNKNNKHWVEKRFSSNFKVLFQPQISPVKIFASVFFSEIVKISTSATSSTTRAVPYVAK